VTTNLASPSDDELVAIVAAVEMLWPRAQASAPPVMTTPMRWRFAGRWWTKPVPARRDRPW
jgi:hypothetical protein